MTKQERCPMCGSEVKPVKYCVHSHGEVLGRPHPWQKSVCFWCDHPWHDAPISPKWNCKSCSTKNTGDRCSYCGATKEAPSSKQTTERRQGKSPLHGKPLDDNGAIQFVDATSSKGHDVATCICNYEDCPKCRAVNALRDSRPVADSKPPYNDECGLEFSADEQKAIADLANRLSVSGAKVIKLALREYQVKVLGTPDLGDKKQPLVADSKPVGSREWAKKFDAYYVTHMYAPYEVRVTKAQELLDAHTAALREQITHLKQALLNNVNEDWEKFISLKVSEHIKRAEAAERERDKYKKLHEDACDECVEHIALRDKWINYAFVGEVVPPLAGNRKPEKPTVIEDLRAELARVREALDDIQAELELGNEPRVIIHRIELVLAALQPQVELPAKGEKNG